MNIILLIILLLLMLLIGGKRGLKSFISLCINFFLLITTFYFITLGINPIIVALIGCLFTSYIILFFVNGKNQKTKTSFISVFITLIILSLLIYLITLKTSSGGFGYESYEEINMFQYDINIDMNKIEIAVVLIGLIGATIDTAIAISSALYEIYINNQYLNIKELFKSGMSIGKDILCTTTNTLLFAYISDFMTLLIWFKMYKYSLGDIINAKVFASEFLKILCSGIGCIIIIPITAIIASYIYKNKLLLEEN